MGDSSPPDIVLPKDKSEPLGLHIQQIPLDDGASFPDMNSSPKEGAFQLEDGVNIGPSVEHQFISSSSRHSPLHRDHQQERRPLSENLSALRNGPDEDISFSLQLGDNEPKRRRSEPPPPSAESV